MQGLALRINKTAVEQNFDVSSEAQLLTSSEGPLLSLATIFPAKPKGPKRRCILSGSFISQSAALLLSS